MKFLTFGIVNFLKIFSIEYLSSSALLTCIHENWQLTGNFGFGDTLGTVHEGLQGVLSRLNRVGNEFTSPCNAQRIYSKRAGENLTMIILSSP